MLNAEESASAYQIARDLGMTPPDRLEHDARVRTAMVRRSRAKLLLHGIVEADETYVGGKPRRATSRDDDMPSKRGAAPRRSRDRCRRARAGGLWRGSPKT